MTAVRSPLVGQIAPARPAAGMAVHPAIARQYSWRAESSQHIGLKVNLYRSNEVAGLARALQQGDLQGCPIECLMVGDSYFMTHLGRPSTQLATAEEREWGLETLIGLVSEVRSAMTAWLDAHRAPYLIADLPDGAADDPDATLRAADRFLLAGADVIKVELDEQDKLVSIEAAAARGIPTITHIGYTPQRSSLGRYGDSAVEGRRIFAEARRARDAGACAIVLEMVSEPVNRALSMPAVGSVPVYSIFSGRAPFGGQSLNVWDSAVRPAAPRKYFPPTAVLDADAASAAYTPELLADCLAQLIRLTLAGDFPLTPPTAMTPRDQEALLEASPWQG